MLSAFTNVLKIEELRKRILFTLAMIFIVRLGAAIPCPGINTNVLAEYFKLEQSKNGFVGLLNIFTGGALENCAIFSLSIMPYISASIMIQLMTAVVPSLSKMAREEGGRQKITQYTRYFTIVLCLFQGYMLAVAFQNPQNIGLLPGIDRVIEQVGPLVPVKGWLFNFTTVIALTSGTMLLMWLGEQITDKGIGNGISVVITVGIVARLPTALLQAWQILMPSSTNSASFASPLLLVVMLFFLIVVIAATIAITQAVRRLPVQYAKQVRGNKMFQGQTQVLPLKVNYAGVMPIIFAQSILIFPTLLINLIPGVPWAGALAAELAHGFTHYLMYVAMILFFSYFWVATQFNPIQIADDLKRHNGLIPGYRPGPDTAAYLDYVMTRLTLAGAIFLTVLAILPSAVQQLMNIPLNTAQFFGGTSLLIIVGVMLDTMRQMETYLLQRHYDGFLKKGRVRTRSASAMHPTATYQEHPAMLWLYVGIAVLVILTAIIKLAWA
ncbi:MAG: preprotein translocase subunit SecY [Candidatus Methylacidiphilales bacterium]|nr:preprotein translocase subunit SecY [Candidatus Methylacidiphilales bacterium]